MSTPEIEFHPISPIGGVEVFGIDLRQEQTERVKRRLRTACLRHSFLLIRTQEITLDEQFRFGGIFGKVLENRATVRSSVISETSTVTTEQRNTVTELLFHFDHWLMSNFPQPLHFTMLYGVHVVPDGGETIFANARRAYQHLPRALKIRIADMQAVHCYDYTDTAGKRKGMRIREQDVPADQPRATHPVVLIHPKTRLKLLYVSPSNTDRFLGLASEESEALFQELCKFLEHPENVYAHRWQVGDVLLWDNHALLHGRTAYDVRYKRSLRRLSIL